MNPQYDEFIKHHPYVSVSKQITCALNDFQETLLSDSEYGFFIQKPRRAGATTALTSFASFYLTFCNASVLYVTSEISPSYIWEKIELDMKNSGYPDLRDKNPQIKICRPTNIENASRGYNFGLVILDDIFKADMTDEMKQALQVQYINKDTIWLCTTSLY